MPQILGSEKVHDCLWRVRYRYRLASPVTGALVEMFSRTPGVSAQVYDARSFLPQSKPVFQVHGAGERFLIAGAFGLDYVTVTYAKGEKLEATSAMVEEAIRCLP